MKICARSVLDETIPGIIFNENGEANYCKLYDMLCNQYPKGDLGKKQWEEIVLEIKKQGANKEFDCIIGVSGGTDSCYMLHMAKELGLRPLAVLFDNGWNSEIAVQNIKKVTKALDIELETIVVDYEEMKTLLRSFMKANIPWIDGPTDVAILASLYGAAKKHGVKYILNGSDFRSEGSQPNEWTHTDARMIKYIANKFEGLSLKSFPNLTFIDLINFGYINKIMMMRPFYYVEYDKQSAQKLLMEKYDWSYYGGHHHENIFTKFAISYWLPKKFGVDKRKITLSAQVMSGHLTRDEALQHLSESPYDPEQMELDKDYVLKKLDLTQEEFNYIWNEKNKTFYDYPTYYPVIKSLFKYLAPLFKYVLPFKPMMFTQMELRGEV